MPHQSNLINTDQDTVFKYLKHNPDHYVSEAEISRRADGKKRFLEEPRWASTALSDLIESNLVETDGVGRYRLKTVSSGANQPGIKKAFIAPQLEAILRKSGLLPLGRQ